MGLGALLIRGWPFSHTPINCSHLGSGLLTTGPRWEQGYHSIIDRKLKNKRMKLLSPVRP